MKLTQFIIITCGLVCVSATSIAQSERAPGLTFEVHLGTYDQQINTDSLGIPAFVKERQLTDNRFQYTCGEFSTRKTAEHYQGVLAGFTSNDLEIVSLIHDKLATAEEVKLFVERSAAGIATSDSEILEEY